MATLVKRTTVRTDRHNVTILPPSLPPSGNVQFCMFCNGSYYGDVGADDCPLCSGSNRPQCRIPIPD